MGMLPMLVEGMDKISELPFFYHDISSLISVSQLRKTLLMAYDITFDSSKMSFNYRDKSYSIYLANRHLIMTPGVQVIVEDIDEAYFYSENETIYLRILKNGKTQEYALAKKDSFYLDSFLGDDTCNDEFFEPISLAS